jgi:hypothetical protein
MPLGCGFDSLLLGGGYDLLFECSEFEAADIRGNHRLFHNRSLHEWPRRCGLIIAWTGCP